MSAIKKYRIGIVGVGCWGANYVRIFSALPNVEIVACADIDTARLNHAKSQLGASTLLTTSFDEVINNTLIDGVVIATPVATHFDLVKKALRSGKHVLVEKPITYLPSEAEELVAESRRAGKILMVGHTFLFNKAVHALKNIVRSGKLGRVLFLNATRTNLGTFRNDVNVIYDLAPHDISIILALLGEMPISVSAQGGAFLKKAREEVGYITLRFSKGVMAHIHVSWLEPVKVRRVTVVGEKKMVVFNDVDVNEPIRVYDKGVDFVTRPYSSFEEFQAVIREGDVVIPRIPFSEPLQDQCKAFLENIEKGVCPISDGAFGVQVLKVLAAAEQSLRSDGQTVFLETVDLPLKKAL